MTRKCKISSMFCDVFLFHSEMRLFESARLKDLMMELSRECLKPVRKVKVDLSSPSDSFNTGEKKTDSLTFSLKNFSKIVKTETYALILSVSCFDVFETFFM